MKRGEALSPREVKLWSCYLGGASALAQVVLIREILTVFRGNEFIIGIIFASWFLGVYLGARLSPSSGDSALARRLRASLGLLPVVLAISVYAVHGLPLLITRVPGSFYSFFQEMMISFIFTSAVSFFVGYVFPPLVKLLSRHEGEGSGGSVYYLESLGSFAGGLVFSFILVRLLNPLGIVLLIVGLYLLVWSATIRKMAIVAAVPILLILFTGHLEQAFMGRMWKLNHAGNLTSYTRTQYQTVFVEEQAEQVNFYGDGILLYTIPDRYEMRHLFHIIMACKRNPGGSVLLFGSGPGSVLYNLLQSDVDEVYYCEPDHGLWDAALPVVRRTYPGLDGSSKLRLVSEDIKSFLSHNTQKFDLIVNLASMPENIMYNRYFTREFYRQCGEHLSDRGVMIASVQGFSNYLSPEMNRFIVSIYKAFSMGFSRVLVTSGETMLMMGTEDKSFPATGPELIRKYGVSLRRVLSWPLEDEIVRGFTARELSMLFEQSQLDYFYKRVQETVDTIEENSDARPLGYWNLLKLSSFQEQSFVRSVIEQPVYILILALVFIALIVADVIRRSPVENVVAGSIMLIVGFVSISAVMVLIILYQNNNGIVYYRISLINAVYMLGLTLGSYISNRIYALRPVFLFPTMFAAVLMIAVYYYVPVDAVFWLVLVFFALLSGSVFPVLFKAAGDDYRLRASVLDSMDHFGSIAGSLLTVLFFLPVAGIPGTVVSLAGLIIAAWALSLRGMKTISDRHRA